MTIKRIREYQVSGRNADGAEIQGELVHLTRHHAVLEIFDLSVVLRVSQSLAGFQIALGEMPIYSGRAVVASLIHLGDRLVCDLKLAEEGFAFGAAAPTEALVGDRADFNTLLSQWQQVYRIKPEFKVVVADLQLFLMDLRLWLGEWERKLHFDASPERNGTTASQVRELCGQMVPAFNSLHERFEEIGRGIEPELRPAHEGFTKRQLHALTLCAPFAHRTFHKPLGYAGDYEMVNMMLREPLEGGTLYAKALNGWFLEQWPARAHRNRVAFLAARLREEALRARRRKRPLRVLNLGCGPAQEVLQFLAADDLCDQADLTLLDFNRETVEHTTRSVEECRRRFQRATQVQVSRKSVHQLLKEGMQSSKADTRPQFDYIYCAGLFDYLTDRTCNQIVNIFHDWLAPEGLLVVTNVADYRPFRFMLEFLLDWNLIYRDVQPGSALIPDRSLPDDCRITRDPTGVNVFVEVRKPCHA